MRGVAGNEDPAALETFGDQRIACNPGAV